MSDEILGEILTAPACAARLLATPWEGAAVYVLWDRANGEPIYCGTSKSKGRLQSHLKKDDPLSRVSSHNLRNPELTNFWRSQAKGWMGVSFRLFPTEAEAKVVERQIIARLGIRSLGGQLYNQRMSG